MGLAVGAVAIFPCAAGLCSFACRVVLKSSQGLLFSEARKPYAEAVGHGRRGWRAQVRSPPPPGLSKEPGQR